MQIPRISHQRNNMRHTSKERSRQSFMATPQQIINAAEKATICPGKKRFLQTFANFFETFKNALEERGIKDLSYNLKGENKIPESIMHLDTKQGTLKEVDELLNSGAFVCSPSSTCKCGAGLTKRGFMANLLETLGVQKPDIIELT